MVDFFNIEYNNYINFFEMLKSFETVFKNNIKTIGLNFNELIFLSLLAENENTSIFKIGKKMKQTISFAYKIKNNLVKKGLVEIEQTGNNEKDKLFLKITKEGQVKLKTGLIKLVEYFKDFSPKEVEVLDFLLNKLIINVIKYS